MYAVNRGFITADLGLFTTAQEAVALAVRLLPTGLGPIALAG